MGGRILGHQTFMTLKETDDEKKIDKQWDILKTKIMQPNLALIFSQVCAVGAIGTVSRSTRWLVRGRTSHSCSHSESRRRATARRLGRC